MKIMRHSVLALICMFAVCAVQNQKHKWRTSSSLNPVPDKYLACQAVVMEKRVTITYSDYMETESKSVVYETYKRIKIVKPDGKDRATFSIYQMSDETVKLHARTITTDGNVWELDPKDILIRNVVEGQTKRSIVSFPKVEVGSEIEFVMRVKRPDYQRYFDMPLQEDIPVLSADVRCILPEPEKIGFLLPQNTKWPTVRESKVPLMESFTFKIRDIPALAPQTYSSAMDRMGIVFGYVFLGAEDQKDRTGLDSVGFAQNSFGNVDMIEIKTSRQLKRQARRLTDGHESREKKMEAIYAFVLNDIELAVESRPEFLDPDKVLTLGKATRRGKRALLQSLLAQVGIRTGTLTVLSAYEPMTMGSDRVFLTEWAIKGCAESDWAKLLKNPPAYSGYASSIFGYREYDYGVCAVEHKGQFKKEIRIAAAEDFAKNWDHIFVANPSGKDYGVGPAMFPDRYGYPMGAVPACHREKPVCLKEAVKTKLFVVRRFQPGGKRKNIREFPYGTYVRWLGKFGKGLELERLTPHTPNPVGSGQVLISGRSDSIRCRIAITGSRFKYALSYYGDISSEVAGEYMDLAAKPRREALHEIAKSWSEAPDSSSIRCKMEKGNFNVDSGFHFEFEGDVGKHSVQVGNERVLYIGEAFLKDIVEEVVDDEGRNLDYWIGAKRDLMWVLRIEDASHFQLRSAKAQFENEIGRIRVKKIGNQVFVNVRQVKEHVPVANAELVHSYLDAANGLKELKIAFSKE